MVVWNFLFMINLNGILNRIAVGLGHERASVVQVWDCGMVNLVPWCWESKPVFGSVEFFEGESSHLSRSHFFLLLFCFC